MSTSGKDSAESFAGNKKRKVASPIKASQDYSYLLRRQEQSASPALKKRKELKDKAEELSSDEEISFLNTARVKGRMATQKENANMETDELSDTELPSPEVGGAGFSFAKFTAYMEEHVTSKLVRDIRKVDGKLESLAHKVDNNGAKVSLLERRISRLERGEVGVPTDLPTMLVRPPGASVDAHNQKTRSNLQEAEKRSFSRARRSLKIFPIEGNSDSELLVNLVDFTTTVLALPRSVANGGAIESI